MNREFPENMIYEFFHCWLPAAFIACVVLLRMIFNRRLQQPPERWHLTDRCNKCHEEFTLAGTGVKPTLYPWHCPRCGQELR